jgi:hypothetical protein
MRNEIPCEVIEDLLPLYADNLTQSGTNQIIKEHLKECESCLIKYENMTGQMGKEGLKEEAPKAEIDYLKKIKRKNQNKIVLAALSTILIVFFIILAKLFIIGSPIGDYQTKTETAGGKLMITGEISDTSKAFRRYEIKDGALVIYGTRSSFINHKRQFALNYELNQGDVLVNGDLIKTDGTTITEKALNLYKHKNPYIGGMPGNATLAGILEIYPNLGSFTNELQTTKEPYGWTLRFEQEVLPSNQTKFDSMMESYAAALLALINNCGEITWTYVSGDESVSKTYTLQDANRRLEQDVKSFSASPEGVQELLDLLNIK